jgi:ABC-type Fe3+ transport system permease subunit
LVLVVGLMPLLAAFWPAFTADGVTLPPILPRLATTLNLLLFTVAIALLVGIPAAFALRGRLTGSATLVAACAATSLPPVLHAAAWLSIFPQGTIVSSIPACALIQGLALAPFAALTLVLSLARVDHDLEDALQLELSGLRRQLWRLRNLYRGPLLTAALVTGVLAVTTIAVTDLLLVRTLAEETFARFQVDGHAATAKLLLPVSMAAAITAWLVIPSEKAEFTESETGRETPGPLWLLLPLIVGAAVPLAYLLRDGNGPITVVKRWSHFGDELLLSLITASIAAVIGLGLSWFIAWDGWRGGGKRRRFTAAALAIMLITPACFTGIGLIHLFSRPGLYPVYDSPAILVLAQLCRALPFQTLLLIPFVQRVPTPWLDASALEAPPDLLNRLRLLGRPLAPVLAAVVLIGFVFALQELDASSLVAPPGTPPLAVRLFTMLHYGLYPDVAAMGLLLMTITAIPAAIGVYALQRNGS